VNLINDTSLTIVSEDLPGTPHSFDFAHLTIKQVGEVFCR